jgi:hypothetical protein
LGSRNTNTATPELDKLVFILSKFIKRGARPINPWALQDQKQQIDDIKSATADLRLKVTELSSLADISAANIGASNDLKVTLGEIDKTYHTVNEAITRFLSPALSQGKIDPTPYLNLERDEFSIQIEKGKGHCGLISVHYGSHGGLRDWLVSRVSPEKLQKVDNLFSSFTNIPSKQMTLQAA